MLEMLGKGDRRCNCWDNSSLNIRDGRSLFPNFSICECIILSDSDLLKPLGFPFFVKFEEKSGFVEISSCRHYNVLLQYIFSLLTLTLIANVIIRLTPLTLLQSVTTPKARAACLVKSLPPVVHSSVHSVPFSMSSPTRTAYEMVEVCMPYEIERLSL